MRLFQLINKHPLLTRGLSVALCLSVVAPLTLAEPVPSSCTLVSRTCVKPGGTRYINHVPVTADCWGYQNTYRCGTTPADTCKSYESSCRPSGIQPCLLQIGGQCVKTQFTYLCPTKHCDGTALYCGKDVFCLDGHCAQQTPTNNKHFGQAAGELAAVAKAAGEAAGQINGKGTIRLFQGHKASCSQAIGGFADCCKNSGWGKDAGLAQCSDQEKKLGKDKEHYLVTYVGKYCHNKVAGRCTSYHRVYCVYDSKLARIVSDYGRAQLGKSYGSAKAPDCTGFSLDEFKRLNFNRMNFITPIYLWPNGSPNQAAGITGDLKVHKPTLEAMTNTLKKRIAQDQQDHTPSSDKALRQRFNALAREVRNQQRGGL